MTHRFPHFRSNPIPYTNVRMLDGFWAPRQRTVQSVSIPWAQSRLDADPTAEAGNAVASIDGRNVRVGDLEAIKFIETMAAVARLTHDDALAATAGAWSDRFTDGQESDGYLPHLYPAGLQYGRWHVDWYSHELYALGHFLDASLELAAATGDDRYLEPVVAAVENATAALMDEGRPYGIGCAGLEPALIRLYDRTGDPRHLAFCQWLVEQRGRHEGRQSFGPYAQDHLPVEDQRTIEGHAVRAAFLYAGVAGLVGASGDERYLESLRAVWANMVEHKMYKHGASGSVSAGNEGYLTDPDVLPLDDCYGESCSVYGNIQWGHDMFRLTGEASYLDDMEWMLYNAFPASLSLAGDTYTYENPAEQIAAAVRPDWHPVPCCPPNILKLITKVGGLMYSIDDEGVFVNLYGSSEVDLPIAGSTLLRQSSNFPWDGAIRIEVDPSEATTFAVRLRIPRWARTHTVAVNGEPADAPVVDGWATIERTWQKGDTIDLDLPMEVVRTRFPESFAGYEDRVAIERGPILFCLEQQDVHGSLELTMLTDDADLTPEYRPDLLGGTTVISTTLTRKDGLMYRRNPLHVGQNSSPGAPAILVPYALWANRRPGGMRTWHPTKEKKLDYAVAAPEPGNNATRAETRGT